MNISKVTVDTISDDAITLDVKNTVLDARNIMMKYNISRVVVINKKELVGIVTEKDILHFLRSSNFNRRPNEIKLNEIISDKKLITVGSNTHLITCAKLMLNNNVSSLIVTRKNSKEVGIITKTDIVEHYSKFCKKINKVKDYMTTPVFSISKNELVHEAMRLLLENKVSRLLVIKNDKAVGIITGRDLMPISSLVSSGFEKYKTNQFNSDLSTMGIKGFILVEDIMRNSLITVMSNNDLADAAKIMIRNRISGIPVVDKNEKVNGIVTKTDIVRAFSMLS
ncbi:MAG: CBS domain-containing protein [Nitrososphaeraceae archaeon]